VRLLGIIVVVVLVVSHFATKDKSVEWLISAVSVLFPRDSWVVGILQTCGTHRDFPFLHPNFWDSAIYIMRSCVAAVAVALLNPGSPAQRPNYIIGPEGSRTGAKRCVSVCRGAVPFRLVAVECTLSSCNIKQRRLDCEKECRK
jgi:hypothetical protein